MFSRPSDALHIRVDHPAPVQGQFGCIDCLLDNKVDAVQAPLYSYRGKFLCAAHVQKAVSTVPFTSGDL